MSAVLQQRPAASKSAALEERKEGEKEGMMPGLAIFTQLGYYFNEPIICNTRFQ